MIEEDVELSHVVFDKEVDINKRKKTYRTKRAILLQYQKERRFNNKDFNDKYIIELFKI